MIGTNSRCAGIARIGPSPRLAGGGGLAVEDKHALQCVVPSQVQIVAEPWVLRAVLRRLGDKDRRTRHRGKDRVAEGCGRAVGALVGFEFGRADLADLERASALVKIKGNRCALDRNDFADQLGEIRDGPPSLPEYTLRIASCCDCEAPSSTYRAMRKLPCSTFLGMCETIAMVLPATSMPSMVPLSK